MASSGAPLEGTTTVQVTTQSLNPDSTDELTQIKASLQREKAAKRKMYSYLVKIADELKTLRNESEQLIHAAEYARKAWYEGGMWRGPNVLPAAAGLGSPSKLQQQMHGGGGVSGGNADSSSQGGGNANNNEGVGAGPAGGMAGPTMVPRAPVSLSDLFLGE